MVWKCVYVLVVVVASCGHAEDTVVTNVGEQQDAIQDETISSTVSHTQILETVTQVQATEAVSTTEQLDPSLSTSLPPSQSELSTSSQLSQSTEQIEPSFTEVKETSLIQDSVQQAKTQSIQSSAVHQSLSHDVSDNAPSDQDQDLNTDVKTSNAIPEPNFAIEIPSDAEGAEITADQVKANTPTDVSPEESVINTAHIKEPDVLREEDSMTADSSKTDSAPKTDTPTESVVPANTEVPVETEAEAEPRVPVKQSSFEGKIEPGLGGLSNEVPVDIKEEEGLTFNEWTQKILAEAEKDKQDAEVAPNIAAAPTLKQRKKRNYAAHDCGAKILASNPEAMNPKFILNGNKDEYMNNPCKAKKWFVIELCEPIQAHSVDIASLELFSSQPKHFRVYLSDRYPTKDWKLAGEYETKDERIVQTFAIKEMYDYFAKYVKVELVDHYGDEHFCPLTIFRVLGTAVIDYEEDHHVETDDDDDDDDEVVTEDAGDSKNLFTSAKNTVMNIVKKVLNVNSEQDALMKNGTEEGTADTEEATPLNATTPEDTTLPCEPDARIHGGGGASLEGEGHHKTMKPQPPQPGMTDHRIVTKLEDDEQVETSPDVVTRQRSLADYIHDCSFALTLLHLYTEHSVVPSQLCQFVYLVSKQNPTQTLNQKSENQMSSYENTVKVDTAMPVCTLSLVVEFSEKQSVCLGETNTPTVQISSISHTETVKSDSETSDVVHPSKCEQPESGDSFCHSVDKSVSLQTSSITKEAELSMKPATATSAETGTHTESATRTVSVTQVAQTVHRSGSQSGSHFTSTISKSESQKVEPSPSLVATSSGTTLESSGEATPALPDSWKPETKDVQQDKTSVELKKPLSSIALQTTTKQMKPEPASVHDGSSDTVTVAATPTVGVKPTVTPEPTGPNGAAHNGGIQAADQQSGAGNQDVSQSGASHKVPGDSTGVPNGAGNQASSEQQDQQKDQGGSQAETSDNVRTKKSNTTIIDNKVVVENGGQHKQDNLNLIHVPVVTGGKRESAIMRLSNRIKVLEQNVSLSSRFLEELSRRYKKQSEDMMRMLNKTREALHNATIEAAVKDKLHDDEISSMERRLQNLTSIIQKLTQNFDTLNTQVTDRQMIWTTIEIVIIVVMLLFFYLRRKQVLLPPEVKQLIEAMPSKTKATIKRRNSFSGPETPSKEQKFLTGGGLQRFSSETCLAAAGKDVLIISPKDGACFQPSDIVKKKKKKKSKNLENRLFSNAGGPYQGELSSIQSTSNQTGAQGSQSQEHSLHRHSQSTNCFGTLLSNCSKGAVKQRSNSLGTINDETVSMETSQTTTKGSKYMNGGVENVGTKTETKGLVKKPPASGGSRISPKLSLKVPKIEENVVMSNGWNNIPEDKMVKGHRRQKSLPKQHYLLSDNYEVANSNNTKPVRSDSLMGQVEQGLATNQSTQHEIKKSVSFSASSVNCFEKPQKHSHSFVNGYGEHYGPEQMEQGYPLQKNESDFVRGSTRTEMITCETQFNGHLNGHLVDDNLDENIRATEVEELGASQCTNENEIDSSGPVLTENVRRIQPSHDGVWRNLFGIFR